MTIKEAAVQSGVGIETLRFYERERLIPAPPRTPSGYRIYTAEAVRRIQFIKRAQKLGFSLPEIRELLAMKIRRGAGKTDFRAAAQKKIQNIDEKIKALQGMRTILVEISQACRGEGPAADCPILQALEQGRTKPGSREAL